MEIRLNNQFKTIPEECNLQQLLDSSISGKQNGIAVAVNSRVITKEKWDKHLLQPNDDVLIIRATQGG